MSRFRLLVIFDGDVNGAIDVVEYQIESSSDLNGFDLLHRWLVLLDSLRTKKNKKMLSWYKKMHEIHQSLFNRSENILQLDLNESGKRPMNLNCYDNYLTDQINENEIVSAYNEKVIICKSSRTGIVYKIEIGGKFYALKVPTNDDPDIIKELINEADIYKRLAYLYVYLFY